MAIENKYLLSVLFFIGFTFVDFYVNAESTTSTTPWPELGARRRNQPTSAPSRDFVSQPSLWNKPNQHNNQPSTKGPSSLSRDYVNSNIALSYSNPSPTTKKTSIDSVKPSITSNNLIPTHAGSALSPVSPIRDYANPNIQLSYSNAAGGGNKPTQKPLLFPTSSPAVPKPSTPARDYVNPNQPPISYSGVAAGGNRINTNAQQLAQTGQSLNSTHPNPIRDYVNPNNGGKVSYSHVVNNNNNPKVSTTPNTRVAGPGQQDQSTTPNPKIRLDENEELQEFSEALLRKDANNGFKHVKVNYQGMTRSNSLEDKAPDNLMTIDSAAFKIPTIEKLVALHNNYIVQSYQNEVYTAQERIEENNFLDAILPTAVMQHTRNFLIYKGKISKDPKDFKDLLRTIWFNMYSRGGGKIGSSGFEHIYLAEIKNDAISGLHNWVYFNDEEKKKTANYLGYMKKLEFDKGAILKFHFTYQNIDKPVGSMFIGTSPEFELALYSTCFLMRPDDVCPVRLGGKNFVIRTYTYRYRGKNMIGSAFPEI